MSRRKKFLLVLLVTVSIGSRSFAQDVHFSQYAAAPMTLNPAMTSSWKDLQLIIAQKQQWQTVDAFSTSGLSFEVKLGRFNWEKIDQMTSQFKKKLMKGLAVGINLYSDKAGDASLRTNNACLGIAYHARLDELNVLSAGFEGGILQRSISPDKLRFNSQYNAVGFDPTLGSNENIDGSQIRADFGLGLLWTYGFFQRNMTANDQRSFHAGFSVMHINRPDISFLGSNDRLNMRFTLHGGSALGVKNTNVSLCPSFMFMSQGKQKELTLGMAFKFQLKESSKITGYRKGSAFTAGVYYRNKDALIPYVNFEFDAYSLGLSYDVNTSGMTTITSGRGGVEVTLRFANPVPFLYQNKSSF